MKLFSTIFFSLMVLSAFSQLILPYRKGDQWGLCDESKKVILKAQYDSIGLFSDCGLAIVKQKNKFGFIDCMGKLIIPCRYQAASTFFKSPKCMALVKENGVEFFIDSAGKKLTDEKTTVSQPIDQGIFNPTVPGSKILRNGKVGFACEVAADSIPPIYESINPEPYSLNGNYVLKAQLNGKLGVINCSNQVIISFSYDMLQQHSCKTEGTHKIFFAAAKDNLFGVLDQAGKIVIPFKYASLELMDDGFSKVKTTDGKWGYVALNGFEYFED